MTIWKNTKNNRLYLIYTSTHHYYGMKTAEPYGWSGKVIHNAKMKNFIKVGVR